MKLLLVLWTFAASLSFAQPYYRGNIEVSADSSFSAAPSQLGWTLAGHLEAGYDLEPNDFPPVALHLMLDPSVRFSEEAAAEPGLTEAYARLTEGAFDLSAGVERLPLEYARLTVPFSVEPTFRPGVRQGVPGVRALWYPGNYRVRAALFYRDTLTPLVSVKRSFGDFELEGVALYHDRAIFGVGGSGLVNDLVVYGEAWLLSAPLASRGALGVTGYTGDSLWTLEGAYALPGKGRSPRSGPTAAPGSTFAAVGRPCEPRAAGGCRPPREPARRSSRTQLQRDERCGAAGHGVFGWERERSRFGARGAAKR